MRMIGEFGAAVAEATDGQEPEPERSGFLLAGETFYVDPDLGFVPFGSFAQAASSGLDTADMDGAAAIMEMMHDVVGDNPGDLEADPPVPARTKDQEWGRFKQVATANKLKLDVLLEIIGAVFSGESGRPTEPPSDSPNGQSRTETSAKSNGKSSVSGRPSRRPANSKVTKLGPDKDKPQFEPVTADVISELGG